MVDVARGEVRTVRAGFTSTDVAVATGREAVLRVEDQDRVLESRWGIGDPPRCLREDVAPGVLAIPCTKEQAEAVGRPAPVAPTRSPLDPLPQAPPPPKHFTLPEYGFDLTLPGATWVAEAVAGLPDDPGPRKVASISSRLLAADVRVEWDPAGGGGTPEAAEEALLARLRRVSKDVAVVGARRPVLSLPGAFRVTLLGTVRKERLRTEVLFIDRGAARLTLLAACPEAAWEDTRGALESLLTVVSLALTVLRRNALQPARAASASPGLPRGDWVGGRVWR